MLQLIDVSLRRDEPLTCRRKFRQETLLGHRVDGPRKILLISDGSVAQFKILLANTFRELE